LQSIAYEARLPVDVVREWLVSEVERRREEPLVPIAHPSHTSTANTADTALATHGFKP
jgi:hypothetical protein